MDIPGYPWERRRRAGYDVWAAGGAFLEGRGGGWGGILLPSKSNGLRFEKRSISAPEHEGFYCLLVVLDFVNMRGHKTSICKDVIDNWAITTKKFL